MHKPFLAMLNFFYPKTCVSCQRDIAFDSARNLCDVCFNSIRLIDELCCVLCGAVLPDGGAHCFICKKYKRSFDLARSAVIFEGSIRQMIHALKYKQGDFLALELSFWLAHQWLKTPEFQDADMVIPVPLHSRNLRERGYNQSELLARHFLRRLSKTNNPLPSLQTDILLRTQTTQSQMSLSREERLKNVQNAFEVKNKSILHQKTVLMIDDVCTTAFTLDACARTLKENGAKKILGLTLARD